MVLLSPLYELDFSPPPPPASQHRRVLEHAGLRGLGLMVVLELLSLACELMGLLGTHKTTQKTASHGGYRGPYKRRILESHVCRIMFFCGFLGPLCWQGGSRTFAEGEAKRYLCDRADLKKNKDSDPSFLLCKMQGLGLRCFPMTIPIKDLSSPSCTPCDLAKSQEEPLEFRLQGFAHNSLPSPFCTLFFFAGSEEGVLLHAGGQAVP